MKHTPWALALTVMAGSALAPAEAHDARLRAWIVSPRGEVDGMVLTDHASIRFSERVGRYVTQRVRVGDHVAVSSDGQTLMLPQTGWSTDLGLPEAPLARGGGPLPVTVTSRPMPDGFSLSSGPGRGVQHFEVRGTVSELTHTRSRSIDGFVIRGGVTVRVPVTAGEGLARLRPGTTVSVEGDGVRGAYGIGLAADRVIDDHGRVVYPRV